MKRLALLTTLALTQTLALALLPLPAAAAEIVGTVSNETTGRPAADISVSLLALERQLSTVAETVTDAEGRYRLVVDAGQEERFLVQASYGGANYNRPVVLFSDGTTTVDVTVYESGAGLGDLDIQQHIVFLSRGDRLLVVTEIFNVLNRTEPPRSFVPDQEGFRFALPEGAQDLEVSVSTPSGMPLRQQSQESSREGQRTITYAFRPGETEVRVSYVLAMDEDSTDLRLPLALPAEKHFLVLPAGSELTGPGFTEIDKGISPDRLIFQSDGTNPEELAFSVQMEPEALARAAASGAGAAPAPESRSAPIRLVQQPVNRAQFYVVGLGLFVLAMGLYYLTLLDPTQTAGHDTTETGSADAD